VAVAVDMGVDVAAARAAGWSASAKPLMQVVAASTAMARKSGNRLRMSDLRDAAGAVTHRLDEDAGALQQGEVHIGQWRAVGKIDVLPAAQCTAATAHDGGGQRIL